MTWKLDRTAAKARAEKPRAVRGSILVGEHCGALTGNNCLTRSNLGGCPKETAMDASVHRYSR